MESFGDNRHAQREDAVFESFGSINNDDEIISRRESSVDVPSNVPHYNVTGDFRKLGKLRKLSLKENDELEIVDCGSKTKNIKTPRKNVKTKGVTASSSNRLPSTPSTICTISSTEFQVINELIDLPSHEFHTTLESECVPTLTSVRERTEPIYEDRSDVALKKSSFDLRENEYLKQGAFNNSCTINKESRLINTDVHNGIDNFAYVTFHNNFRQEVENTDNDAIENASIMKGDDNANGERSTSHKDPITKHKTFEKINNQSNTEHNNTYSNKAAKTGCKGLTLRFRLEDMRRHVIQTRNTTSQENDLTIAKKRIFKIKKTNNTEHTLSRSNCKSTNNNTDLEKNVGSTITRRKRTPYASKTQNDMKKRKPNICTSETESDSSSLFEPSKFEELEKQRKKCIKHKHFKNCKSKTNSSRFQETKKAFDNSEDDKISDASDDKITSVDKNKPSESDDFISEDEDDFNKKNLNYRNRLCSIRKSSTKSTKHGRTTKPVIDAERDRGRPNIKVVKKTGKKYEKKPVKLNTEVKQSKISTVARNEIIDETMRTTPTKILNAPLEISKHINKVSEKRCTDGREKSEEVRQLLSGIMQETSFGTLRSDYNSVENNTLSHGNIEIARNDDNIVASTSRQFVHDNTDAQFKDADIINNDVNNYLSRKQSSVGNISPTKSNCSVEVDPLNLGKRKSLSLKRNNKKIVNCNMITVNSGTNKIDSNLACTASSTKTTENMETVAETSDNNRNENIAASLEKLVASFNALDNRSNEIIYNMLSEFQKKYRKLGEERRNLIRELEEKYRELEIQAETINFILDLLPKQK